MNEQKVEV